MGKDKMTEILKLSGVKFNYELRNLFKEGSGEKHNFPIPIHEEFFNLIKKKDEDYVHFNDFMPYLLVFFIFT
jgi:hypothetical protein